MLRVLFWILAAYFVYRFVFDFLAPVLKVSLRMRKQMKDFQRHAEEQTSGQQQYTSDQHTTSDNSFRPKAKSGEYIDFEEVKD